MKLTIGTPTHITVQFSRRQSLLSDRIHLVLLCKHPAAMLAIIRFLPRVSSLMVSLLLSVGKLFLAEGTTEAFLAPLPPLMKVAQRDAFKLLPCEWVG